MSENDVRKKPVTLAEMARIAGVNSRTVADALKGTGRVAPATREKVLKLARELNYVPNAAARALATGRTGSVAVLSGPLNEFFYANIAHSLESHLTANGYEMTLLPIGRDVKDLMLATQASMVDGVIVIVSERLPEEFLRSRSNSLPPCVVVDTTARNFIDHITLDLAPAVEEVLRMMMAAGRSRIAYVVNNRDEAAHVEVRMRTYLKVMAEAGRTPEMVDVDTKTRPEERIQAIQESIKSQGCPDALLCQNDETAIYTYRAVVGLGYRIPNDVLLVGCDGLPYMEFFHPPLSTIALPTEEICVNAAQFLQQRMADPAIPVQQATLPGRLIVRESLSLTP